MTKSVAIFGCGPAGLMVAHAARLSDWNFRIYSNKQKSKLFGAQYLHAELPRIECGMPREVNYVLRGTPEQYRAKVYGAHWDGTVSPEDYSNKHNAWDIRTAYNQLWIMYSDEIQEFEVDQQYWGEGMSPAQGVVYDLGLNKHDLVISTLPRKIWARPGDEFKSEHVWALGDADWERVHLYRPDSHTVVCDGTSDVDWYRCSNIFGFCTMEWPSRYDTAGTIPPARGASIVHKPLSHNSKEANDFIHVGRYGKWQKGVLSTDAFFDAMEAFAMDDFTSAPMYHTSCSTCDGGGCRDCVD